MRQLTLTENAPAVAYDLTAGEAEALATAELAQVARTPGAGTWMVAAGHKVGVAKVGELQVVVRPKVRVDQLFFLLGYTINPTHWRDQTVFVESDADLVEALAHSFRRLAFRALEQGLMQGYRVVDDSLPVLRGRIRVADQISRQFGRGLPLEVTYDDFTVDIPENQILLAATIRLLKIPGVPRAVRHGLQRLRFQLADVTALGPSSLPAWTPSRLNARYHSALRIAEVILNGESIAQRVGEVAVSGFVLDMWRVYENFVSVALREALAPYGGSASFQHRMHLDEAAQMTMRPDFLWTGHDGRQIVADAKYKAEKPAGFPEADLYQMLAYCTVLGISHGHLVYARGNGDAASHEILGSEVTVTCHTLDLAAAPRDLLAQVAELAERFIAHPANERSGA